MPWPSSFWLIWCSALLRWLLCRLNRRLGWLVLRRWAEGLHHSCTLRLDGEAVLPCTLVEKPLGHVSMTLEGRNVLHRALVSVQPVNLCLPRDEELDDLVTASLHCSEQRCHSKVVLRVYWVAFVEEVLHEILMAIISRFMQRCTFLVVCIVNGCLLLDQQFDDGLMVLPSRLPQCRTVEGLVTPVQTVVMTWTRDAGLVQLVQPDAETIVAFQLAFSSQLDQQLLFI
mmetsp:Transcript_52426/g.145316  ORF Transcript_52426/g.145316 Transcript_52426/m.145316 type:complete len:228 (+) Transcript_52426:147-830(+)